MGIGNLDLPFSNSPRPTCTTCSHHPRIWHSLNIDQNFSNKSSGSHLFVNLQYSQEKVYRYLLLNFKNEKGKIFGEYQVKREEHMRDLHISVFGFTWTHLCPDSGLTGTYLFCFIFLDFSLVVRRCCPCGGCRRRASCTASSPSSRTSGALGCCSGRSSRTASSPSTSCPIMR